MTLSHGFQAAFLVLHNWKGLQCRKKKEGKGRMKAKVEEELKFGKCLSKRKTDGAKQLRRRARWKAAFGTFTLQALLLCVLVYMLKTLFSEVKMLDVNILKGEK